MNASRSSSLPAALLAGAVLFLSGLGACGDDGGTRGPGRVEDVAKLELSDGAGTAIADGGTVGLNGFDGVTVIVRNTGTKAVSIKTVTVAAEPAGGIELGGFVQTPSPEAPVAIEPNGTFSFQVYLSASAANPDQVRGTVTLATTLFTDSSGKADTAFEFNVRVSAAGAKLLVQPGVLDFQQVDTASTRTLALLNTGVVDLEIFHFYLSGHPGYSVKFGETIWPTSVETSGPGVTLDPPLVIKAGESAHAEVTYTSNGPDGATGKLLLKSNAYNELTEVQLLANVAGPCILVTPSPVDFGGKEVGVASTINLEIQSCGDLPLEIKGVDLNDDGSGAFSLDAAGLGLLPVTVQSGQSVFLPLTFVATEISDATDPALGNLEIRSNAFIAEYDVELSGYGTDGTCPQPVITVTEGSEVIPQTVLHLTGVNSTASTGSVANFEWEVIAPPGSASIFVPSNGVMNPSFTPNIVGQYIFKLKVWDSAGNPSCDQASYTVIVTSDEAIHVELLWTTPGDPDETDEGDGNGSDVDLHFLHPFAGPEPAAWGDYLWDCYFSNPLPNWAGSARDDNPRLDRDDTDGAGPENLNLTLPEFGTQYRVAVHYYDDWAFGDVRATVRFYIYGNLVETYGNVPLRELDMWQVGTIDWPGGTVVKTVAGPNTPKITPNVPRLF